MVVFFYDKYGLLIGEYYGFKNPYQGNQLFKLIHFLVWSKENDEVFLKFLANPDDVEAINNYKNQAFTKNITHYNQLLHKFAVVENELNEKIVLPNKFSAVALSIMDASIIMDMSFRPVY